MGIRQTMTISGITNRCLMEISLGNMDKRSLLLSPLICVRIRRKMRLLGSLLIALLASVPSFAQINLEGEWAGRYHEDQADRVPGNVQGDFTGIPMNDAARRYAESFD